MDYSMDHLEREIAGIAARLEQMERDRADEKRVAARTPGGLLVPKTVSLPTPATAPMESAHIALAREVMAIRAQVDEIATVVKRMARIQASHQAAIEDLSLMSTLVVPE